MPMSVSTSSAHSAAGGLHLLVRATDRRQFRRERGRSGGTEGRRAEVRCPCGHAIDSTFRLDGPAPVWRSPTTAAAVAMPPAPPWTPRASHSPSSTRSAGARRSTAWPTPPGQLCRGQRHGRQSALSRQRRRGGATQPEQRRRQADPQLGRARPRVPYDLRRRATSDAALCQPQRCGRDPDRTDDLRRGTGQPPIFAAECFATTTWLASSRTANSTSRAIC